MWGRTLRPRSIPRVAIGCGNTATTLDMHERSTCARVAQHLSNPLVFEQLTLHAIITQLSFFTPLSSRHRLSAHTLQPESFPGLNPFVPDPHAYSLKQHQELAAASHSPRWLFQQLHTHVQLASSVKEEPAPKTVPPTLIILAPTSAMPKVPPPLHPQLLLTPNLHPLPIYSALQHHTACSTSRL